MVSTKIRLIIFFAAKDGEAQHSLQNQDWELTVAQRTKTNSGKFFKRWEYQTTWPASWEICMQVRKQQLELDMEQQTGSK